MIQELTLTTFWYSVAVLMALAIIIRKYWIVVGLGACMFVVLYRADWIVAGF